MCKNKWLPSGCRGGTVRGHEKYTARIEVTSDLLSHTLIDNAEGGIPTGIAENRKLFEPYLRGLFHAGGRVNTSETVSEAYLLVKRDMAEQLAVRLYLHYGILARVRSAINQYGKLVHFVSIRHPQDLRKILKLGSCARRTTKR